MKKINADQITTNMNGSTLEIFIDGRIAAEISEGRSELGFVYDVLEGMGYEVNEDNFSVRPMLRNEEMYSYKQSQQLSMQTGFIGYLRADFGSKGNGFYSTWNEFNKTLKTPEFSSDLDFIINSFREKDSMFQNRETLGTFCAIHPEWELTDYGEKYYGVRVDTTNYAYMLRLTPRQGDYNIYCYCYKRDWLDKHIANAERGIRFIDPNYNEQFVLADGDSIRITMDGWDSDRFCRYIDDYHVEVGSELFHICQFAELMQKNGNEVIPLRSSLPEQCYVYLPTTNEIGIVKKGENGYYRTDLSNGTPKENKELAEFMNGKLGVSKAQVEAMKAGSMVGWKTPAADPKNYDDNGTPMKPKRKNKDFER